MSAVSLTLIDGTSTSIEADDVLTVTAHPYAVALGLYATDCARVCMKSGQIVDVRGAKATVLASITAALTVFGTRYQYAETEAEINQATVVLALAQSIVMPADTPAGTYRVEWSVDIGMLVAPRSNGVLRVDVDATSDTSADGTDLAQVTLDLYAYTPFGVLQAGFRDIALTAAAHTIRMKYSSSGGGGGGTYVNKRRLSVFRVA